MILTSFATFLAVVVFFSAVDAATLVNHKIAKREANYYGCKDFALVDCCHFQRCGAIPTVMACAPGTVFDSYRKQCVWPRESSYCYDAPCAKVKAPYYPAPQSPSYYNNENKYNAPSYDKQYQYNQYQEKPTGYFVGPTYFSVKPYGDGGAPSAC